MQSWNQWPLSTGAVTSSVSQPPLGYATSGTDPLAAMQAYMQYYNQPAPSGYTTEQWAAAQQQNWAQWQQWQQQYQQWQAQYGEKYQETMKHFAAQSQAPCLSNISNPPLPQEDIGKPPPPPGAVNNAYQFSSLPPTHKNNPPLFPARRNPEVPSHDYSINPPLPTNQSPLLSLENHCNKEGVSGKRGNASASDSCIGAKKFKAEDDDDDLTDAEKKFDAKFKEWEEQFNKWKHQNANHPDKAQYKQYEAQWTSWREKLIERREQMRKKREQQRQANVKLDAEKLHRDLSGGDKILNLLSNTENQGLINNLLGIGKTLGLTGKQEGTGPPPPPPLPLAPPPPPPTNPGSMSIRGSVGEETQLTSEGNATKIQSLGNGAQAAWNTQRWATGHGYGMDVNVPVRSDYNTFPLRPPNLPPPRAEQTPATTTTITNFSQPPPSLLSMAPNFSRPPPGFFPRLTHPESESSTMQNQRGATSPFRIDKPPPFDSIGDRTFGQVGRSVTYDRPIDHYGSIGTNDRFTSTSKPYNSRDEHTQNTDDRNHEQQTFHRNEFDDNEIFNRESDRYGGPPPPPVDRFVKDRCPSNLDQNFSRDNCFGDREFTSPSNANFGVQRDNGSPRDFRNQFEPVNQLSPEIKKLMEKRKASMDVFKPTFSVSDKPSTNSNSLSESFKKISGESPFRVKDSPPRFDRPREFSPDHKSRSSSEFATTRNAPPPSNPLLPLFGCGRGNRIVNLNRNSDSAYLNPPGFRGPLDRFDSGIPRDVLPSSLNNEKMRTRDGGKCDDPKSNSAIPPLERPTWMDVEFPEPNIGCSLQDRRQNILDREVNDRVDENRSNLTKENLMRRDNSNASEKDSLDKKCVRPQGLPFMEENDPKPEDMNMEPPPQLPNFLEPMNQNRLPFGSTDLTADTRFPPRFGTSTFKGVQAPRIDRSFGPTRDSNDRRSFGYEGAMDNSTYSSSRGTNDSNIYSRTRDNERNHLGSDPPKVQEQTDFNRDRSNGNKSSGGIPSLLDMNFPNPMLRDPVEICREEKDARRPLSQPLPPRAKRVDQILSDNKPGKTGDHDSPPADCRNTFKETFPAGPRYSPSQDFVIAKQFNYNHGGAATTTTVSQTNAKPVEHFPSKVIDYAHVSKKTYDEHLIPLHFFDYSHGGAKPAVPDRRRVIPKKDFKHWEETEQNLKEYAEVMNKCHSSRVLKLHTNKIRERYDDRRFSDNKKHEERKSRTRVRRDEKESARAPVIDISAGGDSGGSGGDENSGINKNHMADNDNGNNNKNCSPSKDRFKSQKSSSSKDVHISQEQSILSRSDKQEQDNNMNDERSKGNITWQQPSNVNPIKPELQVAISTDEIKYESSKTTFELVKTSNCTMVDDLLCPPGRQNRPPKIAIILRGPPGSGKSYVAKLIKDKEVEQGGSAPRILSLDDYFLVEKEIESVDDNGKKTIKEMIYEYEEAMEPSYIASLIKAFKKNITDGFFNFIVLDCINEKISDYEDMWSFAKSKGFRVYVCEMDMDLQICLKRNIHNRSEDEINKIIDYFEPTPNYHQTLDVNSILQEQTIEEVQMEDIEHITQLPEKNEDSQDSQEDISESTENVSKWEKMETEDKLDRLDGLAKKKSEKKPQTMEDFLQVPDYYDMEDTPGKKRVRWADLEERKEQEKMRAVGFVVGHTNWDRMMDPTKGESALIRTKYI